MGVDVDADDQLAVVAGPPAADDSRWVRLPVSVHIVLERDGCVLLIRRAGTGYRDGWLSVPAGHLDGGEEMRAGAARELREEVGVDLTPDQLVPIHVMHRREARESVDFFVRAADGWRGEPVNREPHKCSELRWCAWDALPADVVPYVRRALDNHRAGRAFDSFGW